MRCPSLEKLTDFLRDAVVGTERATIQAHLAAGCPSCQHNQQWLLEVKRIAPLDDSFAFPAELTARILAWMPAAQPPTRTPLRTLIAQLLFDSFAPLPLAEARSATSVDVTAGASTGRQLLYQVEGYAVDLRLEKMAETFDLLGQVLPEDPDSPALAGCPVHLGWDEQDIHSTQTDAEGMFRLSVLPPNAYCLRIVLGEDVIEIPEIKVH